MFHISMQIHACHTEFQFLNKVACYSEEVLVVCKAMSKIIDDLGGDYRTSEFHQPFHFLIDIPVHSPLYRSRLDMHLH